ncbi:MAG: formate C-acetyltransferase/glycerol dehydratase family glycyl radical enzyme [Candidatus Lokiarchaeota archaeon]|nr:formate C-acetyltransferase/glycerol dehydratase family glycyl radical enzyme [Candidatus Lokiarchaeota archaeon]
MQIEESKNYSYENRIERMRSKIVDAPHEICIERARLFTESYKDTKHLPPIIRFATAMDHYLSNMTLKIWEDEFIVGNRTIKLVGTPLYPEVRTDAIKQDIDTYNNRPVQAILISEKEKQYLKEEVIPYWINEEETVRSRFLSYLNKTERDLIDKLVYTVDVQLTNGIGHFFPGHHNLLKFGVNGLIKQARAKLAKIDETKDIKENSSRFYESVLILLNAVKKFIQRFSNFASEMALSEKSHRRKKELLEIAEICKNIAENPPKTFKEALQLVYFNHLISGLEDGGFAISVGRLDQELYKYYLKDIKNGQISPQEVDFLIKCFYLKLSCIYNYVFSLAVNAGEGPPIAENLTIGGLNRDGEDATNELSVLLLNAYSELQTVQPTFSVRISHKSPQEFLLQVGNAIKTGASIALFNDEVMIPGLMNRGFSLEDAREYAPVGCVEPQHPYKSFGSTNSNQFNIVKCLELTLTNGTDMATRKKYGIESETTITSYEQLWNAFTNQVTYFIDIMVSTMNSMDRAIAELNPQPFLSSTTNECLEKGLDVTRGGAVYNFTGPQLIGLATCADSLAVIKKIVFEEKQLTLTTLVEMLRKNYRRSYCEKKGSVWRELFINKIPKFGNDDDYVDEIAVNVAKLYCDEVSKYQNYRGGTFNPGIYSTSLHLALGTLTGASADGRKARDPLSNGVGPTHGRDKNGPTAIINSVKKLKNELMTNGHSLILAFHPNSLRNDIFLPLIKTYFTADGGYQVQFNVVGREVLCKAQENPNNYRGLVVRIAGYSVYFTELSTSAQEEIIARTQY